MRVEHGIIIARVTMKSNQLLNSVGVKRTKRFS